MPNFIGATLPRCVGGDQDYYCSAMLVLFKPWQSGHDLKTESQSWDESFLSYKFTDRQKELMNNFNICYECLDARDDFHAQFRKGSVILPSWVNEQHVQIQEEDIDSLPDEVPLDGLGNFVSFLGEVGKWETRHQLDIAAIRNVVMQTGWADPKNSSLSSVLNLQPTPPDKIQSGNKWKADVQKARQDLLDLCAKHLPTNSDVVSVMKSSSNPNEVKIVDQSYLQHNCFLTTDL